MQMVLKATDQRGKVPWQETLIPSDNPNWQVCRNTPVNTLHKPVEFNGKLCTTPSSLEGVLLQMQAVRMHWTAANQLRNRSITAFCRSANQLSLVCIFQLMQQVFGKREQAGSDDDAQPDSSATGVAQSHSLLHSCQDVRHHDHHHVLTCHCSWHSSLL